MSKHVVGIVTPQEMLGATMVGKSAYNSACWTQSEFIQRTGLPSSSYGVANMCLGTYTIPPNTAAGTYLLWSYWPYYKEMLETRAF